MRSMVEGFGVKGAASLGGADRQAPRPSVTRLSPRATSPFRGGFGASALDPITDVSLIPDTYLKLTSEQRRVQSW